jgi:cystathionine beta-synthase
VVGVGTGGTISGTARFLKEKNPNIKVLGIDTYGSVFKKYKETGDFDKNEIYPYITEGIGEDFLPQNVDFSLIDHFEKVTDKDAAIYTRAIARDEAIFVGNSAGSAIAGLLQMKDMFKEGDVVVVIFHDHGTRYLGKMFNDEWMRDRGFLEVEKKTAKDLIADHADKPLVTIGSGELVGHAVAKMKKEKICPERSLKKCENAVKLRDAARNMSSIDTRVTKTRRRLRRTPKTPMEKRAVATPT